MIEASGIEGFDSKEYISQESPRLPLVRRILQGLVQLPRTIAEDFAADFREMSQGARERAELINDTRPHVEGSAMDDARRAALTAQRQIDMASTLRMVPPQF